MIEPFRWTTPGPATEEDLDDLPAGWKGQIAEGGLFAFPRPAAPHIEAASALTGLLLPPFRFGQGGPGGWVILAEPEVRFGGNLLIPDLAGWRRERFSSPDQGPYTVRPDWICELLSPSTARFDRIKKMRIYASHEVPHAWVLDPILTTLEVYRLQSAHWLLIDTYEGDAKVRAEPFEAVEVDLGLIWTRGGPTTWDFVAEEPATYGVPDAP
jgi:Uma2 family endonuclease